MRKCLFGVELIEYQNIRAIWEKYFRFSSLASTKLLSN